MRIPNVTVAATIVALVAGVSIAQAQPGATPPAHQPQSYSPPQYAYRPPPPPSPYPPQMIPDVDQRRGLTLGVNLGFGDMEAEVSPIRCLDCDYNTGAVAFDFYLGAMVNPRLAVLLELSVGIKPLDSQAVWSVSQTLVTGALKYWVTPRFWLQGGIGMAHLGLSSDDARAGTESETIDTGSAFTGAMGYEIIRGSRFVLDVQLRTGIGIYEEIDDRVQSASIGLGFNWY